MQNFEGGHEMNTYYLRMEGVNIANVIGDTQDLSTIRGGGLLLLHAVKEAKELMSNLHQISTGASAGLFSFTAGSTEEAAKVRDDLQKHFKNEEKYKHFTFVIDIAEKTDNFAHDRELLLALNRYRQIQSPSIAIPSREYRCKHPCTTDLVRPQSIVEKHYGKDGARISESVYQRRTYGKEQKQTFYENETGISGLKKFASDFGSIGSDSGKGNLNNKLAIIYLDGNGFGNLQTACSSSAELSEFDNDIKGKRRIFLKALFEEKILKDDGWLFKVKGGEECRFEILLWGGDEMVFVVPAWKGWETLQFFYQHSANWKYGDKSLTHAAGLVFCHHKAHIHRITNLAKQLGDMAKENRTKNLIMFKALESFDHIGQETDGYFMEQAKKITGKKEGVTPFLLDGAMMAEIARAVIELKRAEFPRSKIYQYLKELHAGKRNEASKTITKAMKDSGCGEVLNTLAGLLNGVEMSWLHIAELWDYLPVDENAMEGGAE
jgi:hypothetical protein